MLNKELSVSEGLEDDPVAVPRLHAFSMQPMGGQTLAVFTENSAGQFLFFLPASGASATITPVDTLAALSTNTNQS